MAKGKDRMKESSLQLVNNARALANNIPPGSNISQLADELNNEIDASNNFDEIVNKSNNLIQAMQSEMYKISTMKVQIEKELKNKQDDLKKQEDIINRISKEVDVKKEQFDSQIKLYYKEEAELRGKSTIEKILFLIKTLKTSIVVKNELEEYIKDRNIDINKLTPSSMKVVRNFGNYEFSVKDAQFCQDRINKIMTLLTILKKNAENSKKMGQFEIREYYKARGILKAFHFRLNPFDNHLLSNQSKPIEFMRLFSSLEPTITALSALDDAGIETESYDKVVKSFSEFIKEEKEQFFKATFSDEFIENLPETTQKGIFIRCLAFFVLNPAQILDQITKWEKVNPEYRKKFISFLQTELMPTEKIQIAQKEIEELKTKGLI